jgi:hypothetical protein
MVTCGFCEGWNFVRSGRADRLEKKIRSSGWQFIRIPDESLHSGIGRTSQLAMACALKLALRRTSPRFNALEVNRIELTQYPWFFLAGLTVHVYRIQKDAIEPVPDEAPSLKIADGQELLSSGRNPAGLTSTEWQLGQSRLI